MQKLAYAKINLGLDILHKRADGYHEVDMLMQSVGLADVLEFTSAPALSLEVEPASLPADRNNLVYRAAELLAQRLKRAPEVQIKLHKHIFLAAGLAGGSSDAAATLRALNELWAGQLTLAELEVLAAQLGSDIPFCLAGGCARATGRGELLEPLANPFKLWAVLAKPRAVAVSTADAYKAYAQATEIKHPDMEGLVRALATEDLSLLLASMGNVLEAVTLPRYPVLGALKQTMLEAGALISMMSGSGPTIFGLVPSQAAGEKVLQALTGFENLETAVVEFKQPII